MGQSAVFSIGKTNSQCVLDEALPLPEIAVFSTEIGWMGLVGRENRVEQLVFGHSSANDVWRKLSTATSNEFAETDWHPNLRRMLESYAEGKVTDFSEIEVDLPRMTAFQERVVAELRTVPYGHTLTYGELAARAGSPKAARAVGSVMSHNRIPLIIPCHRVVGSAGSLGGFSAPKGVAFKKQLLALESNGVLNEKTPLR
jgi:methylated-DNA-[protein]-cysteine S-methyltransferase